MSGSLQQIVAVIPARYGSTRLPGKPLLDINGKPMIQRVYERVSGTKGISRTIVATDDERILAAVLGFGGEGVMTSVDLASGTDRVAAVADQVPGDIFVNIQGDEPMMDTQAVEAAVKLVASGAFGIATAMTPLLSESELLDPSVVKVVVDRAGRALYFSRHPIPYSRGEKPHPGESFACQRHVGLYVYSRAALLEFRSLPSSPLERGELLEQLRALENGIAIGVAQANFTSIGVDTPEDLDKVRRILV